LGVNYGSGKRDIKKVAEVIKQEAVHEI